MACLYPEAAKKAQAEIDSIVGRERIPNLQDRPALPYTEAFVQEIMRMFPPAPLGLSHFTTKLFSSKATRSQKAPQSTQTSGQFSVTQITIPPRIHSTLLASWDPNPNSILRSLSLGLVVECAPGCTLLITACG
ncbi:cytochrome P450 family protein [Rhizoctonia solani AG-3 Rhs1AP]|uniref:Cytochrome P450 family protein n=1 Tax=Rhizoctonia solani AG-3 Rhs1AP TaxID=1086054 RepID=X8JXA4_9AGAM|nr:cytochrome P450 family protein [Rhizoctonia solani AG-3 Rhs1AP]